MVILLDSVCRLLPGNTMNVDIALVRILVTKQQTLSAAFELFEPRKTKSNAVKLNTAVSGYLSVKLKVDKQSTEHKQLFRDCMEGITPAMKAHKLGQSEMKTEAEAELNHHLNNARGVAGGLRDGTSWKANVKPDMTVQQILDLCSEPGQLLSGPFKQASGVKAQLLSAVMIYKGELSKWGITDYAEHLEQEATHLQNLSQCSAFETQLVRVFKKPLAEQTASVEKYLTLYAAVSPRDVCIQLWDHAQKLLKGQ
jgi:hypothetical protein